MSRLLMDEPPLMVMPTLAELIGLNESLFIQQLHYWVQINLKNKENPTEWVYNTYEEWQDQFKFWSVETIKRVVASLKKQGLILVKKRSEDSWDKTNHYTIDYKTFNKVVQMGSLAQPEESTTPPESTHKESFSLKEFLELVTKTFIENKISSYSDKINNSKKRVNNMPTTKEVFNSLSKNEDLPKLATAYTHYVLRNKNMSARLNKWLLAYKENNLSSLEYVNSSKESYLNMDTNTIYTDEGF